MTGRDRKNLQRSHYIFCFPLEAQPLQLQPVPESIMFALLSCFLLVDQSVPS